MKEISDELLQELAGEAAYRRGVDYYNKGLVGGLKQQRNTITAVVQGTGAWQVSLKHTARLFAGSCDCPASEQMDFCKHCVAVALQYREQLQQKTKLKNSGGKQRLPTYLATLDKPALVALVLDLVQHDKPKLNQLNLQADLAAGSLTAPALKKQITAAIPVNKHLHSYPQARSYFARLETTLETLQPFLLKMTAEVSLGLVDYALERVERALETIDDSGGFRQAALELLGDLHIDLLSQVNWAPQKRVDYLFALYSRPVADCYPPIPFAYLPALGETGMEVYQQTLQQQWDALPPLQSDDRDAEHTYLHLATPLLERARAFADEAAEIAILSKMANGFYDYIRLSGICLEANQLEQALLWRQRAVTAPDLPRHSIRLLEDNQLDIWQHSGNFAAAEAKLWERFSEEPSMATYLEIDRLPRQKRGGERHTKALQLLQFKLEDPSCNREARQPAVNTLAELYLYFDKPGLALDIAEDNPMEPELLLSVLNANAPNDTRVVSMYFRLADFWVSRGDNISYRSAIRVLQEGREVLPKSDKPLFVGGLLDLLDDYKRKRNFCKWLNEAFADLLGG